MSAMKQALKKEINEAMSICGGCKKQKAPLYSCTYNGCGQEQRVLCEKCGKFFHIDEDHEFDINQLYVKKQMLWDANHDQIVDHKLKQMSLTVECIEEEKKKDARFVFFNGSSYGVNYVVQLGLLPEYIGDEILSETMKGVSGALKKSDFKSAGRYIKDILFDAGDLSLELIHGAKNGGTELAKNGGTELAKNGGTELAKNGGTELAKNGKNILKNGCKEGAFIAGAVVFGLESGYHITRYIKGKIELKELGQKIAIAAVSTVGSMVGNIGGSAVGGVFGTYFCPVLGTALGAAIGGFLGAMYGGYKARESMESISWFNAKIEQEIRQQFIKQSLVAFGFKLEHITNKQIFNEEIIAKKYRTRAKEAHPDKITGSREQFETLTAQMTILLSLLDQEDDIKKVIQAMKAIAL